MSGILIAVLVVLVILVLGWVSRRSQARSIARANIERILAKQEEVINDNVVVVKATKKTVKTDVKPAKVAKVAKKKTSKKS